jgi:serine/threonine protein kinase/Tol biopolymer transport system component
MKTNTIAAGSALGAYRVTAALGAGGMGEVWRAEDTRLGREVAIKLLPVEFAREPDRMARFEREARVLASLNHPNIATLYGVETAAPRPTPTSIDSEAGAPGREGDPASSIQHPASEGGAVHFLVMELVEGEDLSDRISRGPIPIDEATPIALQIAEALEAAHDQGIVHRDLKPANIKLRPDGTVKVLDFGLAKAWEADGDQIDSTHSPTLTQHATAAGILLGTAAYMAPEQAAGQPADRRADVWAFGVVLWEMLTGRKLFEGETVSHVLASVLKDHPDLSALPRDLPPRLNDLVERCLRKKPKRRLQSIGDARVLLEDYLSDPVSFQPAQPPAAVAAPVRSRWRWAVPAALVLAGAAAVAGFLAHRPAEIEERVMRFNLESPPGAAYHLDPADPGPVAVSPDGRALVFSARDPDGNIVLYVRELAVGEARRLPGTEGAQYPFWSPDSQAIGFFAAGKLKKIDADGGPPITLCDAPNGKGGAWSASGVIVFAPSYDTPLHSISDAGGESTALTAFDEGRGDNSHRHPRFLPDGRHFLYLARGEGGGSPGYPVVVGSLDGGDEKLLLTSSAVAEFKAGRLLFMRSSTLMARPFDPDRLESTGDAVPLVEDVMVLSGAAVAVFSASDTGILAYQPGSGGLGSSLTWVGRDGSEQGAVGEPGEYREIFLSPDGTTAAVGFHTDGSGAADIWTIEIDRNLASRLTFDPGHEQQIVWSPDSSTVAFARAVGSRVDIFRKLVGGAQEARPVLESELNTFPTSWSPDGALLAFDAESPDTGWDQWILPLDGGEPYPFLQSRFDEVNGVFSPDGRWMAYESDESGRREIYLTPFPGPGRRWRVSTDGGRFASWKSDGSELYYESLDGDIMAVALSTASAPVTIGSPELLFETHDTGLSYPYAPAPGGDRFLLIKPRSGPQSLSVVAGWAAELEKG